MNFTREPIIETVITPREGYRLIIRATKVAQAEEYSVEAVEIVSFGGSIFYRSLERPGAFLLPVGDYEVVETRETKVALKSAHLERSIKITGSKEGSGTSEAKQQTNENKKHHRKKSRRKKTSQEIPRNREDGVEESNKENAQPAVFSRLFPPPPTLIKETLNRSKEAEIVEANLLPEKVEEEVSPLPEVSHQEVEKEKQVPLSEPEVLPEPIYNPDSLEESPEKEEKNFSSENQE